MFKRRIPDIEEYLKNDKGQKSSSRLFSYMLLKFFIAFNSLALIGGSLLMYSAGPDLNPDLVLKTSVALSIFDVIIGMMIFTPKQLSKIAEVKELIALAKV